MTDKLYYQHLLRHSIRIPALYAKSKYTRATMPAVPAANADWTGSVGTGHQRTLLCLGESTMAGVGVTSLKASLPGIVSQHLAARYGGRWSWQTHAHIGYSIKQLYNFLQGMNIACKASVTLVATGGNDTFYLTKPSTWLAYLQRLCDYILAGNPNTKIVFASMPPAGTFPSFGKYMRAFAGGQQQLLREGLVHFCRNQNSTITFVDKPVVFEEYLERAGGSTEMADLFCDGYHPSGITYRLWAEDISQHIYSVYKDL